MGLFSRKSFATPGEVVLTNESVSLSSMDPQIEKTSWLVEHFASEGVDGAALYARIERQAFADGVTFNEALNAMYAELNSQATAV